MAILNLDLVGAYAISSGYEWRVNLYYPGNIINASFWGQIYRLYAPDEGLTKFTFDRAIYEQVENRTKIPVYIPALQTSGMEPTLGAYYVYEIRLTLPRRQAVPILAGKVYVMPTIEAYK